MAVTNNIREIREQRGIYQDDLAAAIGYSTKTVGRIERGDSTPSAEFMLRISKYFNMLVFPTPPFWLHTEIVLQFDTSFCPPF